MIIELIASLVIQTSNIKEKNVDNLSPNRTTRSFVVGDSKYQLSERERIIRENTERIQREVVAREKAERTSRGGSYTGTGGAVTILAKDTKYFNCVKYAKAKAGISASIGNGGRKGINSSEPQVGKIGVERQRYHAVYIEAIEGDNIIISEANYLKGYITQRTLNKKDFLGFVI